MLKSGKYRGGLGGLNMAQQSNRFILVVSLHAKSHRNQTKIVEVIPSRPFQRGVGWLGCSKFFLNSNSLPNLIKIGPKFPNDFIFFGNLYNVTSNAHL